MPLRNSVARRGCWVMLTLALILLATPPVLGFGLPTEALLTSDVAAGSLEQLRASRGSMERPVSVVPSGGSGAGYLAYVPNLLSNHRKLLTGRHSHGWACNCRNDHGGDHEEQRSIVVELRDCQGYQASRNPRLVQQRE